MQGRSTTEVNFTLWLLTTHEKKFNRREKLLYFFYLKNMRQSTEEVDVADIEEKSIPKK